MRTLYPYQQEALDQVNQSYLIGSRRVLLQAPTGSGKTVIAATFIRDLVAQRKRVAFCVSRTALISQTFARFQENGLTDAQMGIIWADQTTDRDWCPVKICSAQTLERRQLPDVDVVVIDEAHELREVYRRWMTEHDRVQFLGLTATPWSKGLGLYFDKLVRSTTSADLIAQGALSKFRVFAPSHPDLAGIKTVAGDYHEGELSDRMTQATLVADVVQTWLERAGGQPTICFAVTRAHAAALQLQFEANGVPCGYVDCYTSQEDRTTLAENFASGAIKVVCNVGVLTTGIDWDVRCLILARPTKSEILFVQMVGRALRTAPGKDSALILDHSDTHLRLGMVTDIDYPDLDVTKPGQSASQARKRKDDIALPKECKACSALIPAGQRQCLECGEVLKPNSRVEIVQGELIEIFADGSRKHLMSATEVCRSMPKQDVFRQLKWIQEERGFKSGWVFHTYRDLYGVGPSFNQSIQPMRPTDSVLAFVRSKFIRYAKATGTRTYVNHQHQG